MKKFRSIIVVLGLTCVLHQGTIQAAEQKVIVYKTPTCGCCNKWVSHLEENGFEVESIDLSDLRMVKRMSGVKPQHASCHTALVDGYVVEGHVPAGDIKRLLKERPAVKGLILPGMPAGSPGMEGSHRVNYDVLTIDKEGKTAVFARH